MLLFITMACTGSDQYGYAGYDMVDHFPLDGERAWIYTNGDVPDWKLEVQKSDEFVQEGDTSVYTFEYWQTDPNNVPANLLMTIDFSSDSYNGVQIHGYEVIGEPQEWGDSGGADSGDSGDSGGARGPAELVEFDPPVLLAERRMAPGEFVETSTGGSTWTSTFKFQEACPNNWISGDNEWNCLYIELDDGDGDLDAGSAVSGRYWIAPRYGMSWFQLAGDTDKWILARAEWAASGG